MADVGQENVLDICLKTIFNSKPWLPNDDSSKVVEASEVNPINMKDLFHTAHEHTHLASDGNLRLSEKMEGKTSEDLLSHILCDMLDMNYGDLDRILSEEVPAEANNMCNLTEQILCKALAEARNTCIGTGGDDRLLASAKFYEELSKALKMSRDDPGIRTDREILCLLNTLIDIASDSISFPPYNESQYHHKWTMLVHTLLNMVVPFQIVNRNGQQITGEHSASGMSQLGFPIFNRQTESQISCIPDSVVAITQTESCGTSLTVKVYQPVLVVEVKTTHPRISGYVRETHVCSSSDSDAIPVASETHGRHSGDGVGCGTSFSDSSSSDLSSNFHKRDTKRTSRVRAGKISKKEHLSFQDKYLAEEQQLTRDLKIEHLIQLIGLLKLTMLNLAEARQYSLRFLTFEKKPMSYGLFISFNRIYLTKLTIVQEDINQSDLCREFIQRLGVADAFRCDAGLSHACSLNYKVSDGFLDLYDPEHLKALLTYLRILVWHEQKITFKRK